MHNQEMRKVAEVQGRLDADLIESFLEAHGIDVELIQEALGHSVIPVTVDGLGRVQIFVPKDKTDQAKKLIKHFSSSVFIEEE